MKTKITQLDWREGRRQRAWELKEQGWKQQDIAAALGVTAGAVSQWLKRGREQGVEGLRRHPAPGRQPRLSAEQLAQLPALVDRGPEAYGFRGQVWTCKRVAEVIRRTLGVRYHPAHVSRLLQTQERAYHSPDVVRFLRVLLRKIRGKLLVIWDGSPIHRGQPIKDFLRRGGARRVHLEQLPGYAPELNPDEGIWNYLKRVERGNLCCRDLRELALALRRAKERLRHKRSVIQACFLQAGYHLYPFIQRPVIKSEALKSVPPQDSECQADEPQRVMVSRVALDRERVVPGTGELRASLQTKPMDFVPAQECAIFRVWIAIVADAW